MNAQVLSDVADNDALIASLRAMGAERFAPVRLHYLEVLAKRSAAHQGSVRRKLDEKLAQAAAAFKEEFDVARRDAVDIVAQGAQQFPQAAKDMQRLYDAGDFKGLQRLIATLKSRAERASLADLVRRLDQHGTETAAVTGNAGSPTELKAIRKFRNTWAKLSVDKQVAQALEHMPKNAGPINSHMLALRSLALMRDISPDYLNRFMSYADTLLSLDQGEKDKPVVAKKPQARAKK